MKTKAKRIFLLTATFIALACGWDWDTIQMEKQQFPQVHELITGKFLRHSQELYYWRIKDRQILIQKNPDSLSLYDDLAMAFDKIGEPGKAIEIMLKKESRSPGLYETYANLGLFHMHNGNMKKGVEFIKKALAVNPDAHFGREKYQLYLGEYILEKFPDGQVKLPLAKGKENFYHYLVKRKLLSGKFRSDQHFSQLSDAIKGVAGMMTFANYRSPILLEVLADLLLHTNSHRGAGHLASRAYLKASWETNNETAKQYASKAKVAREAVFFGKYMLDESESNSKNENYDSISGKISQGPLFNMDELAIALKIEVQFAEKWFDSVRTDEINWIKKGKNPDTEFAVKYYKNKELKNIALNQYEAIANKAKVNNQVWLQQQLDKPLNISAVHGYNKLNDSVKKILDEIYEREFRDSLADSVNVVVPVTETKLSAAGSNKIIIWILCTLIIITAFFWFMIKRKKGN